MSKAFNEADLLELLEQWNGDFLLKNHDGEIRGLEVTRKYTIENSGARTVNQFILKITRMYRFLIWKRLDNEIILTIHVKPESKEEFLNFCEELPLEEKTLREGSQ